MLKAHTAYMLDKKGNLFEVDLHPYLIYGIQKTLQEELLQLFSTFPQFITWFYDHIEDAMFRDYLKVLIKSSHELYGTQTDFYFYNEDERIGCITDEETLMEYYKGLNKLSNQEFLRVRTSNMRFGGNSNSIYFRVGSIDFNWFDIIWKCVYDNKEFISDVSICTDTQARGGGVKFYNNNNFVFNCLPINEFLTQNGNPIVEKYTNCYVDRLRQGMTFDECFGDMYIGKIARIIDIETEKKRRNCDNENFW